MYQGPGEYKHFKGGTYQVLGLAKSADDNRELVLYYSLKDTVKEYWVRELDDFNEEVEGKSRFEKVILQDRKRAPYEYKPLSEKEIKRLEGIKEDLKTRSRG